MKVHQEKPLRIKETQNSASFIENGTDLYNLLIRDVIYCFQGIGGRYIGFKDKKVFVKSRLSFKISVLNLALKLASIGTIYHTIRQELNENTSLLCNSNIVDCFRANVDRELNKYLKSTAELDTQQTYKNDADGLTLIQLNRWISGPKARLQLIHQIIDNTKNVSGASFLTHLYLFVETTMGDDLCYILELLQECLKPLSNMSNLWMAEGVIDDGYNDFFIEVSDHNQNVVHRTNEGNLPPFISPSIASLILRIGTINFINKQLMSESRLNPPPTINFSTYFVNGKSYLYQEQVLHSKLQAHISKANSQLFVHLTEHFNLEDELMLIKEIILLSNSNFVESVIAVTTSFSNNLTGEHLRQRILDAIFSEGNRSFSLQRNWILFKDNIALNFKAEGKKLQLEDVVFSYNFKQPLSMFIKDSWSQTQRTIFMLMFKIHRANFGITQAWKAFSQLSYHAFKAFDESSSSSYFFTKFFHQICIFRNLVAHFISNYLGFVLQDIIEVGWRDFLEMFHVSKSIEQAMSCLENFFNQVYENIFFISNKEIHITLNLLLNNSVEFSRLIAELEPAVLTGKFAQNATENMIKASMSQFQENLRALLYLLNTTDDTGAIARFKQRINSENYNTNAN